MNFTKIASFSNDINIENFVIILCSNLVFEIRNSFFACKFIIKKERILIKKELEKCHKNQYEPN
jgi:hypothetical protein